MNNMDEQIEIQRIEMIRIAKEKGFGHPDLIKASQDLDELIDRRMKWGKWKEKQPWEILQKT